MIAARLLVRFLEKVRKGEGFLATFSTRLKIRSIIA